jgi:hypothetical protein
MKKVILILLFIYGILSACSKPVEEERIELTSEQLQQYNYYRVLIVNLSRRFEECARPNNRCVWEIINEEISIQRPRTLYIKDK